MVLCAGRSSWSRRAWRVNEAAEGIDPPAIETVRWQGPASEIEGILAEPHGYDPAWRRPLILTFHDLMAGADALIAKGMADPGRLFLYGWSYGGYMANRAATHTGHWPIYEKGSPVTCGRQAQIPTLFVHGERDVRRPLAQGLMMRRAIADQGGPAELLIRPREGHEFREPRHVMDRIRRVADGFERFDRAPGA